MGDMKVHILKFGQKGMKQATVVHTLITLQLVMLKTIQRLIQDSIKTVLAEEIHFGKLSKSGGIAYVSLEKGKIEVKFKENTKKREKV